MNAPLFQVDAFTTTLFAGNPAAVVVLEEFLADDVLCAIARENNLSETAFLVPQGEDNRLRWFTPKDEIALCGHATLASAAVIFERIDPTRAQIRFHTASGVLTVRRNAFGYSMDFPAQEHTLIDVPQGAAEALGAEVVRAWQSSFLILELKDAQTVQELTPDFEAIGRLHAHGVVVTAAGEDGYDCVSRVFVPAHGVPEDPVTGSAHCALAPLWAERLGKARVRAWQASARGGELLCTDQGTRVQLEGACRFYLEGRIVLDARV